MFRKFAGVPTSTILLGAVAVKNASSETPPPQPTPESNAELAHYQLKPSELPLYAPVHSSNKCKGHRHPPKDSAVHEAIESGIRVVRKEVVAGYDSVAKQKDIINDYVNTAKEHTHSTIDYLNQPHNIMPRTGAIAIGGLSGFIFAARGGFIKKVIYTTIGAGTVASLCYPRQAELFAKEALFEARKGYAIAYNFVKGVKPGDETPVEPINKFPTSLDDIKYLIYDLYDEAKDALFPQKK